MATLSRADVTRAFALAYFFRPDRTTALQITALAMAKVGLAERAQARRIRYKPKGRRLKLGADPVPFRTKVSIDRAQLLQRLVLLECDLLDRRDEEMDVGALTEEQFALRFVRQVVWSSWRRNSLYVATALGRILHSYSTAEVQGLFSVVVQEPDRTPDDSYVRSVKQSLLAELKRRFGDLVQTRSGARGEEVFETVTPSLHVQRLVDSCLERLTPWDTSCPLPRHFDAFGHTLRSLRSVGGDPEAEHPIEVRRMHSLIHPDCFARLTKGLGLRPPAELLTVPKLFKPGGPAGEGNRAPDRSQPPPLEDGDLDRMRSDFARVDDPGRAPTHVSFRVDGRERAKLPIDPGAAAGFEVDAADGVLELIGIAGTREVPLALHLLGHEPLAGEPPDEELTVAAGRRREIRVLLRHSRRGPAAAFPSRVEAECVALGLFGRARRARAVGGRSGRSLVWWGGLVPTLGLLLAAGVLLVQRQGSPREGSGPPDLVRPVGSPADVTRGAAASAVPATLESARSIYVDALRGPNATSAARLLADRLTATGRFTVVESPDAADLALKGALEVQAADPASPAQPTFRLALQLVDARGVSVWTATEIDADWRVAVERAVADLFDRASRGRQTRTAVERP